MKRMIGWAVCSLLLAGPGWTHAMSPGQGHASSKAKAEQQVLRLEQAWVKAENAHDAAALRRILDVRFISTYGAGSPIRRAAFIHAIVSSKATHLSQVLSETGIVADRDTAVVTGVDTMHGIVDGKPFTHAYRYTITYIRRAGRWYALAEHIVRIADTKAGR